MRFNIISEHGDGVGLAVRLQQEGNKARVWIRDEVARGVGNGLVEKVSDLEDLIVDAPSSNEIYVFDTTGNGFIADALRKQGHFVIGGSVIADRLERDRTYGADVMHEAGIDTPETFTFTSFEEASEFVSNYEDRLVYKPSKQLGDLSVSHVSYDREDMLEMLKSVQQDVKADTIQFELQKFIKGTPISTEMYFDGERFIDGLWNHTLERKELMDNNIGPSGGCVGNIVWPCGECEICRACRKLASFLKQNSYIGPLDLNAILSEAGDFYGLEWTPRFGYDAAPTLFWELLENDLGFLLASISGAQVGSFEISLRDTFASGLRITIPPWPSENFHADKDIPIRGLEFDDRNAYFYNVRLEQGNKLASAGAWGILLILTGRGDSVARSLAKPYKMADALRVKNKQYRTDLREQFKQDLELLAGAQVNLRENSSQEEKDEQEQLVSQKSETDKYIELEIGSKHKSPPRP